MSEEPKKLHPGAFRELKPGETYDPIVPASQAPLEVTLRSVGIGIVMAVIFSLASAYLALKAGQGMEPAIPIAILAVGMAGLFTRRSTILENVIIQSIGAASGAVVAGAVFTIPALYMLDVKVSFWHIFFTVFFGGCLGVFFLIPLRQYLMVKEHGKLPFPEAMATTEILVAGEGAGKQAKILIWSAAVAFVYDLSVLAFGLWREIITFNAVKIGQWLDRRAMAIRVDGLAAIVGLGYIVGLKYAAIIASGSFLSYLVFIPFVKYIGGHLAGSFPAGLPPIAAMGVDDIFRNYVRLIGIGGIAGAGIMGIIRSLPSIAQSFRLGIKGISSTPAGEGAIPRTDRNMGMRDVLLGGFIAYLVGKSTKDEKLLKEHNERGILVASGYIAGGSIAGVVAAVIAAVGWQERVTLRWPGTSFDSWGEILAIVMVALLSVFMYKYSTRSRQGK